MGRSRHYLFKEAIALLPPLGLKESYIVIDLGCIKSSHPTAPLSYGYSTVAWLQLSISTYIHTVDHDQKAVKTSQNYIRNNYPDQVDRVCWHWQDALEFLKEFDRNIDLLYLDGPGRELSKECVKVASSKMLLGSVILMDDCDINGPPPLDGRMEVVPVAKEYGFEVIQISSGNRQALMQRKQVTDPVWSA